MSLAGWIAAIVLFLQLPIPLYWFVLHPGREFWRTRKNAAFVVALLASWAPVTAAMVIFRQELFRGDVPPFWQWVPGAALIVFEAWIFWRVKRDLGGARLVGATELSGGGEMTAAGIYARIRHPRYTASLLAIVGACLVGGRQTTWIVAAIWAVLTRGAIALEERELRARFGAVYEEYCRRVPRFFPRAKG